MRTASAMPMIDPTVKFVGISKLRDLNAAKLKDSNDTLVLQENDTPLAVLLSYDNYLVIQEKMAALMSTLELFGDKLEVEGVLRGLNDISEGKMESFDSVKATLKERYANKDKKE